jgi:hypothetical protein
MNHYEVIIEFGTRRELIRFVEAQSEKEARQIVWKGLSDDQKDCCSDIEVILI